MLKNIRLFNKDIINDESVLRHLLFDSSVMSDEEFSQKM